MNRNPQPIHRFVSWATLLALVATLGGGHLLAQAQQKIAVVNLKTVFDGYWKTKESDGIVKRRQKEFNNERQKMLDDYQKANQSYSNLTASAGDQAISSAERDKRRQAAEDKLREIREIQDSMTKFARQFQVSIRSQVMRMRDDILKSIRDVIGQMAQQKGYNLVLDTAALSVDQTPIVLYQTGLPDMTHDVLTQLNSTAPPGAMTSSTTDTNQPILAPTPINPLGK